MTRIDQSFLDLLSEQAQQNERLRMNHDLRGAQTDTSQRMLNALQPGTRVPIHRHRTTPESVFILRGSVRETFYDDQGHVTATHLLQAGGECLGLQIPAGQWHTIESLEPGTVIVEMKDGAFVPTSADDIMTLPD